MHLKFVLNFLLLSSCLLAQNPEQTFRFGMKACSMQQYSTARLAFERLLFFRQDSFALQSMKQLALISLLEKKLPEAADWFSRLAAGTGSSTEQAWCELNRAAIQLQMKDARMAQMTLLGLPEELPDSLRQYRDFLLGTSYFLELKFPESREAFRMALNTHEPQIRLRLDSLFDALTRIRHPKPNLARVLSIIVPGAGQFYAGDIKNGLNSLLLTGGLLSLGIYSLYFYTPFDAIVAIAPWFQRYYMGGYKRAALIAADRYNEKQNKIFVQILACFSN